MGFGILSTCCFLRSKEIIQALDQPHMERANTWKQVVCIIFALSVYFENQMSMHSYRVAHNETALAPCSRATVSGRLSSPVCGDVETHQSEEKKLCGWEHDQDLN